MSPHLCRDGFISATLRGQEGNWERLKASPHRAVSSGSNTLQPAGEHDNNSLPPSKQHSDLVLSANCWKPSRYLFPPLFSQQFCPLSGCIFTQTSLCFFLVPKKTSLCASAKGIQLPSLRCSLALVPGKTQDRSARGTARLHPSPAVLQNFLPHSCSVSLIPNHLLNCKPLWSITVVVTQT